MGGEKMCAMGSGEEEGSDKTEKRTADKVDINGRKCLRAL
jgi:hypothetical protein